MATLTAGESGEEPDLGRHLRVLVPQGPDLEVQSLAPERFGAGEIPLLLGEGREVAEGVGDVRVVGAEEAAPLLQDLLEDLPGLPVAALHAQGDGQVGAGVDRAMVLVTEGLLAQGDGVSELRLGLLVLPLLSQQERQVEHRRRQIGVAISLGLPPQGQRLPRVLLGRARVALPVAQHPQLGSPSARATCCVEASG